MLTLSAAGGWFHKSYCENIKEAAKYGFKAIEMLGWKDVDLDEARRTLDETGLVMTCIAFAVRDEEMQKLVGWDHGIVYEDSHGAFEQSIRESLEAAQKLGCKRIVVTTGGERSDVPRQVQHDNIVKALKRAAPIVENTDVKIVLEPLNVLVNHKGYYLVTSDEGAQIINKVNHPSVLLLYDVYHQQISEGNLTDNIKKYIDIIGHFHLGDVPGRNQPGTGEINYPHIIKTIKQTGYDGYAALECGCTEDVAQTCAKMLAMFNT